MSKFGRTKRCRARRKEQAKHAVLENKADPEMLQQPRQGGCGDCALRKWMVAKTSKHQLKDTFKLVPYNFPGTGRGLKTKRSILPGTVIVSVPHCLLVTPSCVFSSDLGPLLKVWRQRFTPHQLLALLLIFEHNKGSASEWHLFIKSLPTEYTMPQYFSPEELDLLFPHIYQQVDSCIKRPLKAHELVFEFCKAHWPDSATWASWDRFRWAWCTVASRSVFMETGASVQEWVDLTDYDENYMALCPYLDLLNHTSTATVQAGFNRQNGCYEIVTFDTYHAHEQVFINYGPHDNATLFILYGFTLPENIHNAVYFSVEDLAKLRDLFNLTLWDQKLDVLRKNNLCRQLTCTMEGVSWNLNMALAILAMDWSQLQEVRQVLAGEAVPATLEEKACIMARHLISDAFADRNKFLAEKFSRGHFSPHCQLAQNLLLDDINILGAALQQVT